MSLCFISDIHSQVKKLQSAVDYAISQNLTIIFLGDIFDSRVDYSNSVGVYNLVRDLVNSGHYCLTSNHQDKLIRHLKGNNVVLTNGLDTTVKEFEDAGIDKEELFKFLVSLPYGICFKTESGQEYRSAHAYFPDWVRVPDYKDFHFIYHDMLNRKTRKTMIYGPLNRDNTRTLWWKEENPNQDFIRVSGHYHNVFVGNKSIVLDSECGSGGCLSLYEVETGIIREF